MDFIAILCGVLSVAGAFLLSRVAAECKHHESNPLQLTAKQGEITYEGNYRFDDCSWSLPNNYSEHVLFVYLHEISMAFNDMDVVGCSGYLHLPGLDPICKYPKLRCFLYSTAESDCDLQELGAVMQETSSNCSSASWFQVDTLAAKIHLRAEMPERKTFSAKYVFVKCKRRTVETVGEDKIFDATTSYSKLTKTTSTPASNSSVNLTTFPLELATSTAFVQVCSNYIWIVVVVVLGFVVVFGGLYFAFIWVTQVSEIGKRRKKKGSAKRDTERASQRSQRASLRSMKSTQANLRSESTQRA